MAKDSTLKFRAGILTASDKGSLGEREDVSGPVVLKILEAKGFLVEVYEIIPDEKECIKKKLIAWCDGLCLPLIITTGGTGLSERDVTPEATGDILDREIPGFAEAMRAAGLQFTPFSILSRGIAGTRGKSLIINLPGNPKAAEENLNTVLPVLDHALKKISGDQEDCASIRERV